MSYPPPGPSAPPGPPGYPGQPPYVPPGQPGPPPPGPPFPGPPPTGPPPPYSAGPQGYQQGPPYGPPSSGYPPPGGPPPAGYPGAPGYPQPGGYPAPPGYFPGQGYQPPPPGQGYPPPHGYPPGTGAAYPPGVGYPQSASRDSCDSDPEFGALKSVDNEKRVNVKFINQSGKDVFLFWVNFKGSFEKFCKIKRGGHEEVDTFENHVWLAMKKKKKRPFLLNQNSVYFATAENTTIYIERPPRRNRKRHEGGKRNRHAGGIRDRHTGVTSSPGGQPVRVKFINRTKRNAYVHPVGQDGKPGITKVLSPGKCWSVDSYAGQSWNACDDKDRSKMLLLNHGWFYCAVRCRRVKERVVITDKYWMGSGSSSSSSSSSD